MTKDLKLIECPRDAMQGMLDFIPTNDKVKYINQLLSVGFDTVDFGSFVSPKAIPQLRDTAEVLSQLDLENTKSHLLAIVANERGIADASSFEEIKYLGYPFSISEEFQKRNTNTSLDASLSRVEFLQNTCSQQGKEAVVYLSMAFGNPYGEMWHPDIAIHWGKRLADELGVTILALSDTIGVSSPETIKALFESELNTIPGVEIGAHLHTTPDTWEEKVNAAFESGCRRFDGALKGYGGCPMADDELTGNMPTERMIGYLSEKTKLNLDNKALETALQMSSDIFH